MTGVIIEAIFLGLGLAMDAFSVSVSDGIIIGKAKLSQAAKIALFFGFFQFIMPVIGFAAGSTFADIIKDFDHWVAFVLLAFIGAKMLYEAITKREEEQIKDPLALKTLLVLAVATSIDALAVGVSLAATSSPVFVSSVIIGIVTFLISGAGVMLGSKCGDLFGNKAEIAGGSILIIIGLKILIEHLFF